MKKIIILFLITACAAFKTADPKEFEQRIIDSVILKITRSDNKGLLKLFREVSGEMRNASNWGDIMYGAQED